METQSFSPGRTRAEAEGARTANEVQAAARRRTRAANGRAQVAAIAAEAPRADATPVAAASDARAAANNAAPASTKLRPRRKNREAEKSRRSRSAKGSVREVALAGEDHGDAGLVGRGDDFLVTNRTTWLHNRGATRIDRGFEPILEWEEGI